MPIKKDIIIVFGASGGIGLSILNCLQQQFTGEIYATYNTNSNFGNSKVTWIPYTLNSLDSLNNLISNKDSKSRLQAIIYCIGIPSTKQNVCDTPMSEWLELFKVNCLSFIQIIQTLKEWIRYSKTRITVLSSNTTERLGEKNGAYSVSKSALETVIKTLSKEESDHGVRVNAIAPSLVESPLADHILKLKNITNKSNFEKSLPWGRMITREELAKVVVSMTIDDFWKYITGKIYYYSSHG